MNNTVTYLKALGIILMVYGHTWCSLPYFCQFIYMFHMPLFFFLSGYCFKRRHLQEPKQYLWKKIKGIYWPYVKWSLIFLALHNVCFYLHLYSAHYGWGDQVSHLYSLQEYIKHAILIITIMRDHEQLLGGYWFLNALFYGSIISFAALKIFRRAELSALICLIICFVLNKFNQYMPFYYFGTQAFFAATLILTGTFFADRKIPTFPWWAIAASLIFTFIGSFYWYFELGMFPYILQRTLPYFVTAILSIWSLYSLFVKIKSENIVTRFLTFVGNNTLTILTWHFLMFKLTSLIIILIYHLPIERLAEFQVIKDYAINGWWLCYGTLTFIVCCGICYCNKYIKNAWLKL